MWLDMMFVTYDMISNRCLNYVLLCFIWDMSILNFGKTRVVLSITLAFMFSETLFMDILVMWPVVFLGDPTCLVSC